MSAFKSAIAGKLAESCRAVDDELRKLLRWMISLL
jgi:hypothetical protein